MLDADRLVGTTIAHYVLKGADSVRVFQDGGEARAVTRPRAAGLSDARRNARSQTEPGRFSRLSFPVTFQDFHSQ